MWLISVRKDWKHVLMQKVVILNSCCDIACLTFQLPYITTLSFQSHRRQPTTGSLQSLQRLKERNKTSVRWKSFAVHKLVWWHFQVGWASGLQFVFFLDNVNNQNYVEELESQLRYILLYTIIYYYCVCRGTRKIFKSALNIPKRHPGVYFGPVIGGTPVHPWQHFCKQRFPVTRKKLIFREISKFYFREVV